VIHLENILVPVDFSNTSELALRYGFSLATQLHARLTLVHVMPSLQEFGLADPESSGNLEKYAFRDTEIRLRELVPTEQSARLDIRTVTKEGDVREQLLHVIEQEKIDLVIVGTHGLRGIAKFFLGSTTEHILRSVPVPILTVSPFIKDLAQKDSSIQIRRMVFASDLSSSTKSGLRYAASLAGLFGAQLTLLHVIEPLESGQFGIEIPGFAAFDLDAIRAESEAFLQDAIAGVDVKSFKMDTAVIEGISHSSIVRFADECKADLLVLNLQSKRFLERVMLGATAERVIRSSHIPVLSIPIKAGESAA
jgi:nucleotide-binding universal stress UspA family protein